ncbi:MAG: PTS sugar transporter subunit IIA [Gemmataceae bacterium]
MSLSDLLCCAVLLDGGPSSTKGDLVEELLTHLAEAGHVTHADIPALRDAVLRREQLGSTGIGRGLAIPHARYASLSRALGILAVCRQPVEFDSLDGEPVDLIVLVLAPPAEPGRHLGAVARDGERLLRCLADVAFCQRLRQVKLAECVDPERWLREILDDHSSSSPF